MDTGFFTNTGMLLRVVIFVAHVISAIVMLLKVANSFQDDCHAAVTFTSYQVPAAPSDSNHLALYPLTMERLSNDTLCNTSDVWCRAEHLPDMVDTVYDEGSHVLGSSWNIIVTVMMFEWITASYALFYIDPFDSWLPYTSHLWWGYHPIPVICTLWNLFLLIYLWAARPTINLPVNNLFLHMLCLVKTIIVQNVLALSRTGEATTDAVLPTAVPIAPAVTTSKMEWHTDHFLRHRKRDDVKVGWTAFHAEAPFHQQYYLKIIESSHLGVIPRYMEYSVTAPLLLVGLFVNAAAFAESWKFQYMFVALFVCNQVGAPLHFSILRIAEEAGKYRQIAIYFFVASWVSLVMGLYVFVYTCQDILLNNDATGVPSWVVGLIWFILVLYSLFAIVASRYYMPIMLGMGVSSPDDWEWLTTYLDICSLLAKLPIAWTIYTKGVIVYCNVISAAVC